MGVGNPACIHNAGQYHFFHGAPEKLEIESEPENENEGSAAPEQLVLD